MSAFDDREKGQEAKFAHESDLKFKAEARRNKLLAAWAAEQLGLSGDAAQTYAAEVVAADFEEAGDADIIRKVVGDFSAKGIATSEAAIRSKLGEFLTKAQQQLTTEG